MLATPELIERLKAAVCHAQRREEGGVATEDDVGCRVMVSLSLVPTGIEVMATGMWGDRLGPTIREILAWASITNARVCPIRAVIDQTITEAIHKGATANVTA